MENSKVQAFLMSKVADLEKGIINSKPDNENFNFYDSVKKLCELKITEIKNHYDEILNVSLAMADMDFRERVSISNRADHFAFYSTTLNFINEELEQKIIPFHRQILNLIPDGIILTDSAGFILYANNYIENVIGVSNEDMVKEHITKFMALEDKADFNTTFVLQNVNIEIFPKSQKAIPVTISVSKVESENLERAGYLFLVRK